MDDNVTRFDDTPGDQDHPVAAVQLRDFDAVPRGVDVGPVKLAANPVHCNAVRRTQLACQERLLSESLCAGKTEKISLDS